jgi:predicted nucleotidyltransferase
MAIIPPLPSLLQEQLEPLRSLCLRHGVLRLEVFGSAASGSFDPAHSDLDFIVQMQGEREPGYAQRFCRLAQDLEALYQRPVDLLTERMIRNPYFKEEVQRTRRPLVEVADAG